MGTKYTTQATSGYNASPPSDDGSTADSNKVKWSTIKTKLSDVLKTFAEAINSQLVTVLNTSARAISANDSAAATDHWKTIQVNTASVTVTLADATTMAAGYIVTVANQSSGDITVGLATSTDTIDTVTNATQTISAKEARTYIVNATALGYLSQSDRVTSASETISGRVELATQAEVSAGTDTARAVTPATMANGKLILGTEQASTSGASIDFTGIPSWAKRITVMFAAVSTNGSDNWLVQLGDSGGVENTGYSGAGAGAGDGGTVNAVQTTAGFLIRVGAAAAVMSGAITLTLEKSSSNTWVAAGVLGRNDTAAFSVTGGSKSVSATLDRVRITTTGGTDAFDAGAINILWE